MLTSNKKPQSNMAGNDLLWFRGTSASSIGNGVPWGAGNGSILTWRSPPNDLDLWNNSQDRGYFLTISKKDFALKVLSTKQQVSLVYHIVFRDIFIDIRPVEIARPMDWARTKKKLTWCHHLVATKSKGVLLIVSTKLQCRFTSIYMYICV